MTTRPSDELVDRMASFILWIADGNPPDTPDAVDVLLGRYEITESNAIAAAIRAKQAAASGQPA